MNKKDKVTFLGGTDDIRQGVIHRDGYKEFGTFQRAQDGMPIPEETELVHLSYDEDGCAEIETIYSRRSAGGPAMVNSKAFKAGWDSIFGARQEAGEA